MKRICKNLGLERSLTLRYLFALSLIFCVLLCTYLIFNKNLSLSESDGYIINTSGFQRMLSQRIALLSREIYQAENVQQADECISTLKDASETMARNHNLLTGVTRPEEFSYVLSAEIQSLYFSDDGVDEKVKKYLALAEELLALYSIGGLEAVRASNVVDTIASTARNGLLNDLDNVVKQYELEDASRNNQLQFLESVVFVVWIALLAFEALFIFRPMVREVINRQETLENRNKELTEFSYRISHDLRAPISSSSGLIALAQRASEDGDQEKANKAFGLIQNSLTSLEVLIEDIIQLTKMKMKDLPVEEVFLPTMIESAVRSVGNIPGSEDVSIEVNTEIKHPYLIKRMLLGQILENLISNALKYADKNKENPYVRIMAKEKGRYCEIRVTDNGIGFPEDYRHKMFEIFQRFHPDRSFGSGLGLYLVAQNVKALQGSISYFPLPNGSEFLIKFPFEVSQMEG